jgi:micrococcal nuclease
VQPPPPDLNCNDVAPRQDFTVRHDVPDPDPHGFDGNKDGVGCET